MYKKSIVAALLFCLIISRSQAMQKVTALSCENLPTLGDFASHTFVEKLLKMSAEDMAVSLNNISPFLKELLKKFLDKYHPCEPKVQLAKTLSGHRYQINSALFSPDGNVALTKTIYEPPRVWDLSKAPIISKQLVGHTKRILNLTISPDSRFALTGSDDNTARLWDLTKSPVTSQELIGHTHLISSVAFSGDGRFALTGSFDKTARLWILPNRPLPAVN